MINRKTTPPFKRKPLDLPSDVAHRFVADMKAFHRDQHDQEGGNRSRDIADVAGALFRQAARAGREGDVPPDA